MAYKAKFLHFKTKQSYNTERNKTSEGSDERKIFDAYLSFIDEGPTICTWGKEYKCELSLEEVESLIDSKNFTTAEDLSRYLPITGGTLTGTLTGTTIAANTLKAKNDTQLTLSPDGTYEKSIVVDTAFRPAAQNTTSKLGNPSIPWKDGYITTVHGALDGNASTSDKLKTARTISLDGGVLSTATQFDGSKNITIPINSVKESYLEWGGKNLTNNTSVIDALLLDVQSADRFAYFKPAGTTVEYSRDGGKSWLDYELTDNNKEALFYTQGANLVVGKSDTSSNPADGNCQLRITLNTKNGGIYTSIQKFALYISTGGSSNPTVTIEKALGSTPDNYETIIDSFPLGGWAGWNIVNCDSFITYGNTPSSQYQNIRFTFKISAQSSTGSAGLTIHRICAFGNVCHSAGNEMAKNGHIYKQLSDQAISFPSIVYIKTLRGLSNTSITISGNGNNNNSIMCDPATESVRPPANNFTNFGIEAAQWKTIYGVEIFENRVSLKDKYLPLNGNAATSTKLQTARNITLTGDVTGSTSFDGSKDVSILTTIDSIDASKITSGTIDIARLPKGALERLVIVTNQAARYKLTTSDVQEGDTVKQEDTGVMYFVVDTSNLANENGYKVYTAGAATSVPWSGITGRPTFNTRNITINGTKYPVYSTETSDTANFYAPTSFGTKDQVLTSTGSGFLWKNVSVDALSTVLNGLVTTPESGVFEGGQEYLSTDTLLQFLNKLINNNLYDSFRVFAGTSGLMLMYGRNQYLSIIRFTTNNEGLNALRIYTRNDERKVSYYIGKTYANLLQELDGDTTWILETTIDLKNLKYTLPTATSSVLGGVKVPTDSNIDITSDGSISVLPATSSKTGAVKTSSTSGLSIDSSGTLSIRTTAQYGIEVSSGYLKTCPGEIQYSRTPIGSSSITVQGGDLIIFNPTFSGTGTVTIDGTDGSWRNNNEAFIEIEETTKTVNLTFSGTTVSVMGQSSKIINDIKNYRGFIIKYIKHGSSAYTHTVLVIPITK